jgi:two-component system sensor histidine kinase VicK
MVEAAFTKGERFDMEYPIVSHHDGSLRWVRGVGTMQHYDGKDFFTGVLHDITENKQDEARKNDFIGMVSHELKTPLTSLTAIIQLMGVKLKSSEDPFMAGAMEKANIQVKKMGAMINGFLNVSRLESGKILIDKTAFNLDDLIREIISDTELTAAGHRFNFNSCDLVMINADREKIGSVISNLLSNAVKYYPKGGTIIVTCAQRKGNAVVSVKDEGLGIKAEDQARLFERYYRVSGNAHISGFGIGLYLSAEIIQRHEGRIWVDSEITQGSTFSFSLPL